VPAAVSGRLRRRVLSLGRNRLARGGRGLLLQLPQPLLFLLLLLQQFLLSFLVRIV